MLCRQLLSTHRISQTANLNIHYQTNIERVLELSIPEPCIAIRCANHDA